MANPQPIKTASAVRRAISEGIDFLIDASLTSLDLKDNNITAEGMKYLASALEKNNSLTSLDLTRNNVGAEGMKYLSSALEKNNSLTSLDVHSNNVTAEGMKYLSSALEKNASLTSLDLNGNDIRAEGMKYLASALEKNASLTSLDLSVNVISAERVKYLASALEKNNSLTSLNLRNNYIQPEGVKDLASALEKNNSLTSLNLQCNYIGTEQLQHLDSLLEKNKKKHTNDKNNWNIMKKDNIIRKQTHDQLLDNIQANNWEALASFILEHPAISINDNVLPNDHNLYTRTFVNQITLHTLKQVVDQLVENKIKLPVKLNELDIHFNNLTDEERKLEEQLKIIRSKLIEVTNEREHTQKRLSEETVQFDKVKEHYIKVEAIIAEYEPQLKKWKERMQVDITKWISDDVAMLLSEIGLGKYIKIFEENRIDGNVLVALTTQDLMQSLGLTFKEAKQLLKSIFLVQKYKDIYMTPPGVLQWNIDTVCAWVEDNKLSHLTDAFRKCQITGGELAFLDKNDLIQHLNIKALGDSIKLDKLIKELQQSFFAENIIQKQMAIELKDQNLSNQTQGLEAKMLELKLVNQELNEKLKDLKQRAPETFYCPITQDIMQNPVVAADGHTYERVALEVWLVNHNTSPMTNQPLPHKNLTPSHTLKSMIREFIDNQNK